MAANGRPGSEWLWMPVIFGIIIGTVLFTITGAWWWVTIGALVGAGAGAISHRARRA